MMGCDIHGFWEVKDHTGNWMAFDTINPGRNYDWFGVIAAVRGGPDIGTAGRGMPDCPSGAYKDMVDEWGVDLHSHTWLTRAEVQEACHELNRRMIEAYDEHPNDHEYEMIPNSDTNVSQLIVGWGHNSDNIAWNWYGTVQDLMLPGGNLDECIRMVVCFDS
jgi:hypothetical protein